MKLLFIPFSVMSGLLSGFVAKKLFQQVWALVDDEEPPEPDHRDAPVAKIAAAAALEGAIFRGTRAVVDHKVRQAFANATGTWPGEERADEE